MTEIQLNLICCRRCKSNRWDDGARCPVCGGYERPKADFRPEDKDPHILPLNLFTRARRTRRKGSADI